jgi:hypothetical protein
VHDTKKRLLSWPELHEDPVMLGKNEAGSSSLMSALKPLHPKIITAIQCNALQSIDTDKRPLTGSD